MTLLLLAAALAIGAFVHRPLLGRFGGGTLQHLVRLPGNLLHESAHAVTMLATGYTVAGFTVSLFDRSGRGHVVPGPAWIGLARPWLTNLLSPIAPAFAGVAVLALLQRWSGAPGVPTSFGGLGALARAFPVERWELWVALALAFSVTAEMAPSDIDLGAWWRPALVVGLVLGAVAWGVERYVAPGTVPGTVATALAWGRGPIGRALAMAVWSAVAVGPIAWGIGKLRG
jgi:hypothetical protein